LEWSRASDARERWFESSRPDFVLVELPGVLATFSAWRSRVQIPPRILAGVVRKPAKRPGREPGERLWVRLPPTLLCVGWASASPSGCNPPAIAVQVQLLPDTLAGPFGVW